MDVDSYIRYKLFQWILNQKCIGKIPKEIIDKKKEEFFYEWVKM